jgi:hypothetical protein
MEGCSMDERRRLYKSFDINFNLSTLFGYLFEHSGKRRTSRDPPLPWPLFPFLSQIPGLTLSYPLFAALLGASSASGMRSMRFWHRVVVSREPLQCTNSLTCL